MEGNSFYAQFDEVVRVMGGAISDLWIEKDGTVYAKYTKESGQPAGTYKVGDIQVISRFYIVDGTLYVQYTNGNTETIGPVTDYEVAKRCGFTGSEQEWYDIFIQATRGFEVALQASEDAETFKEEAHGWTNGGTSDPSSHWSLTNNAKYWSEKSYEYSDRAQESRLNSEAWAIGRKNGAIVPAPGEETTDYTTKPHIKNNAKYYADLSHEANHYYSLISEGYARGTQDDVEQQEGEPYWHDNARFYNYNSEAWARGTFNGVPVEDNRIVYNSYNQALISEGYAVGKQEGVVNLGPYYKNNAQYYKDLANVKAKESESWANGTIDGMAVAAPTQYSQRPYAIGDYAIQNNKLYQCIYPIEESEAWNADHWKFISNNTSDVPGLNNSAKYYRDRSIEEKEASVAAKEQSQAWATGKIGDNPVGSSAPQYNNNSLYYSNQAEAWATGVIDGTPATGAQATNNATTQAEKSVTHALISEGYANGKQNGVAVSSGTYFHNNGLYYKQQAEAWTQGTIDGTAVPSSDTRSTTNAKSQAEKSTAQALKSEGYAVGKQNGTDVSSGTYYHDNAKYYKELSASAQSASADARDQSQAWATGKIGNTDVASTAQQYNNHSKYYSERSEAWADSGTGLPSGKESAKAQAEHAASSATTSKNWAVGPSGTGSGTDTNNSKYWAGRAEAWADTGTSLPSGKESAKAQAEHASASASDAKNWAVGPSGTGTGTDSNNSKYWALNAQAWADSSEALAPGKRSARVQAETSATYATDSKNWAVGPSGSGTGTDENNAKHYAEIAGQKASASDTRATNAEQWATGGTGATYTTGNSAKEQADRASTLAGNALTYSNLAKDWATKSTEVESGKSSAKTYAQNAANSATAAKNWAVKSNNTGTASDTNNSQYYSEQSSASATASKNWAVGPSGTGSGTSTNNSKYWSDQSKSYKDEAQKWAVGATTATYATGNSAKEQADRAAMLATGNSSATGSSTNNALYYKNLAMEWAIKDTEVESGKRSAKTYSENAANSATQASSSKDSADQSATQAGTYVTEAHGWANGGTSGSYSSTNNAKYYSSQAQAYMNAIKNITVAVTYQNSTSGTTVPTGTWSSNPNPQQSEYMWTKIMMTFGDAATATYYNVSYIGSNGTGAVTSVNGKSAVVVLYANDIALSSSDSTTIANALRVATNSEIDALFS